MSIKNIDHIMAYSVLGLILAAAVLLSVGAVAVIAELYIGSGETCTPMIHNHVIGKFCYEVMK